jgi:hypothetical protein
MNGFMGGWKVTDTILSRGRPKKIANARKLILTPVIVVLTVIETITILILASLRVAKLKLIRYSTGAGRK